MLYLDSTIAFAASFLTIAIAQTDISRGGNALGIRDPFSPSHAPMAKLQPGSLSVSTLSTEACIRGSTSLAFCYLAYNDYTRATYHDGTSDAEIGLASWRCKAWALCGVTGLTLGPLGPYHSLFLRPLEQRLGSKDHTYDGDMGKLFTRWGRLILSRGIITLVFFPVSVRAFQLI